MTQPYVRETMSQAFERVNRQPTCDEACVEDFAGVALTRVLMGNEPERDAADAALMASALRANDRQSRRAVGRLIQNRLPAYVELRNRELGRATVRPMPPAQSVATPVPPRRTREAMQAIEAAARGLTIVHTDNGGELTVKLGQPVGRKELHDRGPWRQIDADVRQLFAVEGAEIVRGDRVWAKFFGLFAPRDAAALGRLRSAMSELSDLSLVVVGTEDVGRGQEERYYTLVGRTKDGFVVTVMASRVLS